MRTFEFLYKLVELLTKYVFKHKIVPTYTIFT